MMRGRGRSPWTICSYRIVNVSDVGDSKSDDDIVVSILRQCVDDSFEHRQPRPMSRQQSRGETPVKGKPKRGIQYGVVRKAM